METDPLRLLRHGVQSVQSAGRAVEREAVDLATRAKHQADWLLLTLGDINPPPALADWMVKGHQRFEPVPFLEPLLACPDVPVTGMAIVPAAKGPTELLAGGSNLDAKRPGRAIGIDLPRAIDGQLTVTAAAPHTDWGQKGSESAVLTVFVDGKHNQDIVLYGGAARTNYPLSLGPLAAGRHTVTLAYNEKSSTAGARGIDVSSAKLEPSATGTQGLVERFQPYFYGRGKLDNNHTDVPLMMWCEVSHDGADTVLAYSMMHSNEDGGTAADPAAEQSSWGRETDPDPLATVIVGPDGAIKDVHYIGWADEPGRFNGHYEGTHPVLRVARDNNSYDDRGTTPLLFRPRAVVKDFTGTSRESLMEQNPSFYKLSNVELRREGKVMSPAQAASALAHEGEPGFKRPTQVMDLRQYLYVDFNADNPRRTQIAVAVKLKGQDKWYRSDMGDSSIDPLWSGKGLRTAVPLPEGVKPGDVEAIRVLDEGGSSFTLEGINRAFLLDEGYMPQYLGLADATAAHRIAPHTAVRLEARGKLP